MIHLCTSNNTSLLHFEFNEAWLLNHEPESPSDEILMSSHAHSVEQVQTFREYYDDGALRCEWSGGYADDGRFLLEGADTFYYPDGSIMSRGQFHLGRRVGEYVAYDPAGNRKFQWNYTSDGFDVLTTFWVDSDNIKSRARFKNKRAEGLAQTFGRNKGNVTGEAIFKDGIMISKKDLRKEPPSPIGEIF